MSLYNADSGSFNHVERLAHLFDSPLVCLPSQSSGLAPAGSLKMSEDCCKCSFSRDVPSRA